MSRNLPRAAAACLGDRYTSIPNALHALVDTPREFQFLAALLAYRWYPTSPIIPSTETLAKQLDCSRRTIRRTASALEARGLIRREARRTDDARQLSNEYVLCGVLLTLVTRIEAARDQGDGQTWPERRSAMAGERKNRNATNGIRGSQQGWPGQKPGQHAGYGRVARSSSELMQSRQGPIPRR